MENWLVGMATCVNRAEGRQVIRGREDCIVGIGHAPWQACIFPKGPVSLDHNAATNTWMSGTTVF